VERNKMKRKIRNESDLVRRNKKEMKRKYKFIILFLVYFLLYIYYLYHYF